LFKTSHDYQLMESFQCDIYLVSLKEYIKKNTARDKRLIIDDKNLTGFVYCARWHDILFPKMNKYLYTTIKAYLFYFMFLFY
jgi:hypothetical protein